MTPTKMPSVSLRRKLDRLYEELSREEFLSKDPLGAIDRSLAPDDFELLSFLIAGLSYGRVESIYASFASLLGRLTRLGIQKNGRGLAQWLDKTTPREQRLSLDRVLSGWTHRLNTARDLRDVLMLLGRVRRERDSLAQVFVDALSGLGPENSKAVLVEFCHRLDSLAPKKSKRPPSYERWSGTGASWFYANPIQGSTCKRLLMWLRWMVRKDSVDVGLWQDRFPQHRLQEYLFWPVDTHIHKWALQEGITSRRSANWALVEELTAWGRLLCPEDPIRYDFVICQSGMRLFRKRA
jgi:uncharacterized protein (TIGR02757 family)